LSGSTHNQVIQKRVSLKKYGHILLLGFILTIYVGLRANNVSQVKEPKIYPDTQRYLEIASQPVTSPNFWAGDYPVVVPAVHKLLGRNPVLISWFQTLFSTFSWAVLALSTTREIKTRWFQVLTLFAVLAFSLDRVIILWDWVILSESLSGSVLVLYIAAWFWLLQGKKWQWPPIIAILFLGVLWTFTRDTNALINLAVSFLILLWAIFKKDWRYLIFTALFVSAYLVSSHFADMAGRWIGPSMSVLGTRVLTEPEGIAFFEDHGMPVNQALLDFAGEKAGPIAVGFGDEPELDAFHKWYREKGKMVFLEFILSTPLKSFVRFSFGPPKDSLVRGLDRLEKMIASFS